MTIDSVLEDSGFVSIKSIGDIYGEPVTTRKKHGQTIHHNYLMWIGMDDRREFYVNKYYLEYPGNHQSDLDQGEIKLATQGYKNDPSNWPPRAGPINELNTVDFAGAGRFSIVLGIPGWEFYNFPQPGHEPVVFHRTKSYFDTAHDGSTFPQSVSGTYNRSFYNGMVDRLTIDGNTYAIFRCENIVCDENGISLPKGQSRPLLFDINVRVPLGNSGKFALVVIDPVGGNQGPPDQP